MTRTCTRITFHVHPDPQRAGGKTHPLSGAGGFAGLTPSLRIRRAGYFQPLHIRLRLPAVRHRPRGAPRARGRGRRGCGRGRCSHVLGRRCGQRDGNGIDHRHPARPVRAGRAGRGGRQLVLPEGVGEAQQGVSPTRMAMDSPLLPGHLGLELANPLLA